MSISKNIRYLRKKQGWGQEVLAEKLGYKSYTTIQKWESGVSDPPFKVVHELANIFHVDIDDLAATDLETVDKETQPVVSDELSENKKLMYDFIDTLSEDDLSRLVQIAQAAFGK